MVEKSKTYLPLKTGPIGCPETSVFKDQEIQDILTLEDGTERFFPKGRYGITTIRYVIAQKSANLIYIWAEERKHARWSVLTGR